MTIDEQDQPGRSAGSEHPLEDVALAADRAGRIIRDQVAAIVDAAASNAEQTQRHAEEAAAARRGDARRAAYRVLELIRSIEREVEYLRRSASRESDILGSKLGRAALSASALELPPGVPQIVDAEPTAYGDWLEIAADSREDSSSEVEATETRTGPDSWEDSSSEVEATETRTGPDSEDGSSSATASSDAEEEPEGDLDEPQEGTTDEEPRDRRRHWWRS